jgi:hypothetical protein
MESLQRIGAIAAVLSAIEALIILALILYFVPSIGVGLSDFANPAKILPVADHPYLKINSLTTVIFSGTTILIALGVYDFLGGKPRAILLPALAAAFSASAFGLLKGVLGLNAGVTIAPLYRANPQQAATILPAYQMVTHSMQDAGFIAGGIAAILIGWAGLFNPKLPRALSALVIVAGIVAIAYTFIIDLRFIQVPLDLVWNVWLGVVLFRGSAHAG